MGLNWPFLGPLHLSYSCAARCFPPLAFPSHLPYFTLMTFPFPLLLAFPLSVPRRRGFSGIMEQGDMEAGAVGVDMASIVHGPWG